MTSVHRLAQRVTVVEEKQRRLGVCDPPDRLRALKDAAARGDASLSQYAELFADQLEHWRVYNLATVPLLTACRQGEVVVQAPSAALAHPPDEALPETTRDWIGFMECLATLNLSQPRHRPWSHPYWDRWYTPEIRQTAALWVLMVGEEADAVGPRRAAWTRTEDGQWQISKAARTASQQHGIPVSSLPEWFGSGKVIPTSKPLGRRDLAVEPAATHLDERWVSFATLAAAIDPPSGGPDRLK